MRTDTALPDGKRVSGWKAAAHVGLVLLLIGVFAWQVHASWPKIIAYPWKPNWALLGVALGLLFATSALDILIWNRTLGWFITPLLFPKAAAVYIWSYLARYIPGKVPSLLVRMALAAEANRHPVPVFASSAVELALRTASAFLLFLISLAAWGGTTADRKILLAAACIIPLVLICAHPKIMLPVMNWALRVIKQPVIERSLRYREVLGIFLTLLLRWMIYGLAFALVVWAVAPGQNIHLDNALKLIGISTGSWAIGFIIPSPAGLGVTEGAQCAMLLNMGYVKALALVLPFLFRLLTLVSEGLWSLLALVLWRMKTPEPAEETAVAVK